MDTEQMIPLSCRGDASLDARGCAGIAQQGALEDVQSFTRGVFHTSKTTRILSTL